MMTIYLQNVLEGRFMFFPTKANRRYNFSKVNLLHFRNVLGYISVHLIDAKNSQ